MSFNSAMDWSRLSFPKYVVTNSGFIWWLFLNTRLMSPMSV
jgi:hypothetical protein